MDSNKLQTMPIKSLFESEDVKKRFHDMLGAKAAGFMVSVINTVTNDKNLALADRNSILFAAATAAALDLPINQNLGFAYIIPYKGKEGTKAQFQMGFKGYKQLALRSGQFKIINATDVRESELMDIDYLTGEVRFIWTKDIDAREKLKTIGYVAYFELINGFKKSLYMPVNKIEKHAKKYSQSYRSGYGNWKDDFEAMALKTVTKLLLSKDAPLSIEMQKAVVNDQSVISDWQGNSMQYVDNIAKPVLDVVANQKEETRVTEFIKSAKNMDELLQAEEYILTLQDGHAIKVMYENKLNSLIDKE